MDPITQFIATALGGSGPLGVVVYFLLKEIRPAIEVLAREMRGFAAAQDRNAEATCMRLIGTPHVLPEIKEHVSGLIERVKAAEEERKAKP